MIGRCAMGCACRSSRLSRRWATPPSRCARGAPPHRPKASLLPSRLRHRHSPNHTALSQPRKRRSSRRRKRAAVGLARTSHPPTPHKAPPPPTVPSADGGGRGHAVPLRCPHSARARAVAQAVAQAVARAVARAVAPRPEAPTGAGAAAGVRRAAQAARAAPLRGSPSRRAHTLAGAVAVEGALLRLRKR